MQYENARQKSSNPTDLTINTVMPTNIISIKATLVPTGG